MSDVSCAWLRHACLLSLLIRVIEKRAEFRHIPEAFLHPATSSVSKIPSTSPQVYTFVEVVFGEHNEHARTVLVLGRIMLQVSASALRLLLPLFHILEK